MIPNIVFLAIEYFFLALLYLFVIFVLRAILKEVRYPLGQVERRKKKGARQPQPQLVLIAGERNIGARYNLKGQVVIGRGAGSGIAIDDTYASHQHARIFNEGDSFFIEDLGSTNGTYVNGRKISYPLGLRPGDRIKIGKTIFEFQA